MNGRAERAVLDRGRTPTSSKALMHSAKASNHMLLSPALKIRAASPRKHSTGLLGGRGHLPQPSGPAGWPASLPSPPASRSRQHASGHRWGWGTMDVRESSSLSDQRNDPCGLHPVGTLSFCFSHRHKAWNGVCSFVRAATMKYHKVRAYTTES